MGLHVPLLGRTRFPCSETIPESRKKAALGHAATRAHGKHWSRPKTPENGLSGASRGIDARPLDHPFGRNRSKGFESVPIMPFIGPVPPGKEGSGWGRVGDALGHDVFRRSRASFDPAPSLSAKSCRDYPQRVLRGPGRFGSLPPGCRLGVDQAVVSPAAISITAMAPWRSRPNCSGLDEAA